MEKRNVWEGLVSIQANQVLHSVSQKWHLSLIQILEQAGLTQYLPCKSQTCSAQGSKIRKPGIPRGHPNLQPELLPCQGLEQLCCHLQGCEWHKDPPGSLTPRGQRAGDVCLQRCEIQRSPARAALQTFPYDPTCHRCERTLHSSKQINNSFPTLT